MTPLDDQIPPFMYAGSTLGNALYSGLDLKEVFSCVLLATSFEEFDEAVSATIKFRDLCMSIEPTCDFCGVSVKPRCRNDQEAGGCTMNKKDSTMMNQEAERRINVHTGVGGFKPTAAKKDKVAKTTKISLEMAADEGEYTPITIRSHHEGERDLVSIQQGTNIIILSTNKDVDTLIDSLNTILQHTQ